MTGPILILLLSVLLVNIKDSNQQTPVIITGLQNASFTAGEVGYLYVEVDSSITDAGKWYRNDIPLSSSTNRLLFLESPGARQIVIYNIQLSDAGKYRYTIRGEPTSAYLSVTGSSAVVNGDWSEWSQWMRSYNCSATCGTTQSDTATRRRTCNNPSPRNGGSECSGPGEQNKQIPCGPYYCPIDGAWSAWTSWGSVSCPRTCGTPVVGTRKRSRGCYHPPPQFGGKNCTGSFTQTVGAMCTSLPTCTGNTTSVIKQGLKNSTMPEGGQAIFMVILVQDGLTGAWYKDGVQLFPSNRTQVVPAGTSHFMFITNLQPSDTGRYSFTVSGDTTSSYLTVTGQVVINGGWSSWGPWGPKSCSQTCGWFVNGTQGRNRTCTNPVPQNGGAYCQGLETDQKSVVCYLNSCPVDGGWGQWGQWESRNCPCGTSVGSRKRRRICDSPLPRFGGHTCSGNSTQYETVSCVVSPCPDSVFLTTLQNTTGREGGQILFTATSTKPGLKGTWYKDGVQLLQSDRVSSLDAGTLYLLSISKLRSSDAGRYSLKVSGQTTSAFLTVTGHRAINGEWSPWGPWGLSVCLETCGGFGFGVKRRNRTCTNPAPQNGGADCQGSSSSFETDTCPDIKCPIDGGWGQWGEFGNKNCSQTCGKSIIRSRTRYRECNNPAPQYGGAACPGHHENSKSVDCGSVACPDPVNGAWGEWTQWSTSPCLVTCGSADSQTLRRNRTCVSGEGKCLGGSAQTDNRSCGPATCPKPPPTSRSNKSQQCSVLLHFSSLCFAFVLARLDKGQRLLLN